MGVGQASGYRVTYEEIANGTAGKAWEDVYASPENPSGRPRGDGAYGGKYDVHYTNGVYEGYQPKDGGIRGARQ